MARSIDKVLDNMKNRRNIDDIDEALKNKVITLMSNMYNTAVSNTEDEEECPFPISFSNGTSKISSLTNITTYLAVDIST